MKSIAGGLVVLLVVLSGCSGSANSGTTPAPTTGTAKALQVPVWRLGDSWTYDVDGVQATYVVTEDRGSDWFMDTDNAERAWQNARDDISRLGEQRKSDLAGSQGSDRVEFFHWPLTDNLTWSTTWDHAPVTILAHVEGDAARLEARSSNGTLAYAYTYSNQTRWFDRLTHYAADGSVLVDLKLAKSGPFTGTVVRWTYDTAVDASADLTQGAHDEIQFDVPLTATDVWADLYASCETGVATGGVSAMPLVTSIAGVDSRGSGMGGGSCPSETSTLGSIGSPRPPAQGGATESWGYSFTATPGAGKYHALILVRTMTSIPFPNGTSPA